MGKRVSPTSKRSQRRRLTAPVSAQSTGSQVVAQEFSCAADLGLGRRRLDGLQPATVDGVVGVHSRHDLITVTDPPPVPVVLGTDRDPIQIGDRFGNNRCTLSRAEQDHRYLEAADAGNEDPSKKLEPPFEPPAVAVAVGAGRVIRPWDRKSTDDDVPHCVILARVTHEVSTAADDASRPAVFARLGMLDVLSSTPPRPSGRKPHCALHLVVLATLPHG